MKHQISLAFSLVVLFAFNKSMAGVVNGGGGKGVLCGNQLQVLDLYEAQLKGYPKAITSGDFDTDLKKYLVKTLRQVSPNMSLADLNDPHFPDRLLAEVKNGVLKTIIDIPYGETLDFTNDATLPALPTGCSFVQIAINVVEFKNDETEIKVYRDLRLWNKMASIDQVALLVHEYLYWRSRVISQSVNQTINSDDTRFLIGKMFSGFETYEMFSKIWNKPQLSCIFLWQGPNNTYEQHSALAAAETENGIHGTGLYFYILENTLQSARTRVFVPNLKPEQLSGNGNIKISGQIENQLLERLWDMKMNISGNYIELMITPKNGAPSFRTAKGGCHIQ